VKYTRVNIELMKKGVSIAEAARRLRLKLGITKMTTTGHRHNPEVQEKLADFLGVPAAELWGSDYWVHHQRQSA
jgi:lambda repressor-like predicted transcriptional regulator